MRNWILPIVAAVAGCGAALAHGAAVNPLARARVFPYDQLIARTAPNGTVGRNVFRGTLATGEAVAVHETMQPAATKPNPPHRIHHSEIIVVEQGTLAFEHDGVSEQAGPGSIIYVAFGTLHTIENVGKVPAKYVVIQIGDDTKK